ncbi:MAG: amidohydrolase family protein [Proteobacteria bacterium]|nr:amidohydrolase family protein [Pseudomonadota bacterium]
MNVNKYAALVGLSGILIASCTSGPDKGGQESADLILSGARIFTANEQQPWAEAIAIKNGKFIYVGDSAGASVYRSDATQSVNLEGRLVIPGLVDSHAHPGYIEVEQYGNIAETSEEAMLAAVKKYADENPDDEWLRLCCWPIDLYVEGSQGPDKQTLDAVVPDRPVWFVSEWWHSGWLNSKALEKLGVDENTPDPKPGVAAFVRAANGEPTGWVKEGGGWQFFAEHFPIDDPEHSQTHKENMVAGLQLLSESGVTTLYDAGNFGFEDLVYGFMAGLEAEGRLPVRYEGTYQVFTPERRRSAVSEVKRYRREYGGDRLQFNTVKLFMDGIYQNRTSALLEAYVDDPSYVGETILTVEELRDFLLELSEERLDIHVHAEGDLAVKRVLDAVESAQGIANDDFYTRVTISHLGLIDPADLPRIAELGVIANFTPWWFTTQEDDSERVSLGDARFGRMFNPKPLFDLGVVVTLSSDEWWGGERLPTYLNPYFGMQIGHTRKYPSEWREEEERTRPPNDGQLSIEQLIMGYTQNGAYQMRMEGEIGSIEKGKLADLVVLDDSLFDIDSDKIWKAKPAAVLMEGEVIHGALTDGIQR